MDERAKKLQDWIAGQVQGSFSFRPASDDASFRRYFRVQPKGPSLIAVDAPPGKEDIHPFVDISRRLLQAGLLAPRVLAAEPRLGFMLLTDLGSRHYADALDPKAQDRETPDRLYRLAMRSLHQLGEADADKLPRYDDRLLMQEMSLFADWFIGRLLEAPAPDFLAGTLQKLTDEALAQPARFVHRDYHSRNLMLVDNQVGLLDFQDAVLGPVTYDLVSLLRDCYLEWPDREVRRWALIFKEGEMELQSLADATFMRWFDWMGMQRHIKCAGIFCRLYFRDGKPQYLADIPRVLGYISRVGRSYPELQQLAGYVDSIKERTLVRLASLSAAGR